MSRLAVTPARQSRLIGLVVLVAVGYFFVREFLPLPSPPKVHPGRHLLSVGVDDTEKIYQKNIFVSVTDAHGPPWAARWPLQLFTHSQDKGSASIRISEPGGACMEYADLADGQRATFVGAEGVSLEYLGSHKGRVRFDVLDYPETFDNDAAVQINQSFDIPRTDLTLTVNSIAWDKHIREANETPEELRQPDVDFTAARKTGASQRFTDQHTGVEIPFDQFQIRIDAVEPHVVRFAVRREEHAEQHISGAPCGSAPAAGSAQPTDRL